MKKKQLGNSGHWKVLLGILFGVGFYLQSHSVAMAAACGAAATTTWVADSAVTKQQKAATAASPNFVPVAVTKQTVSGAIDALQRTRTKKAGLQFKYPTVSTDASYKSFEDGADGGFKGDESNFNLSGDADIYDGLITGLSYGHTARWSDDSLGTRNNVDDHYGSLYLA